MLAMNRIVYLHDTHMTHTLMLTPRVRHVHSAIDIIIYT